MCTPVNFFRKKSDAFEFSSWQNLDNFFGLFDTEQPLWLIDWLIGLPDWLVDWLIIAGPFDPTQQYYCHIETPTFYTPIVSQSDYYTSILADDSAKKLISQQMSVLFCWLCLLLGLLAAKIELFLEITLSNQLHSCTDSQTKYTGLVTDTEKCSKMNVRPT